MPYIRRRREPQAPGRGQSAAQILEELESRLRSGENVESFLETVGFERFRPSLVVIRVVRIEPITAAIHMEVGDFGEVRGFEQKLLFGNQRCDEVQFGVV